MFLGRSQGIPMLSPSQTPCCISCDGACVMKRSIEGGRVLQKRRNKKYRKKRNYRREFRER